MAKSVFTDAYRALLDGLAKARGVAGLTQSELASRLGTPQSFVSKYERGERRLDVVEFVAVARAIGVDPCELLRSVGADDWSVGRVERGGR